MVEKILSKGFSKEDEPFLVLTARFHTAILIFNYILFCFFYSVVIWWQNFCTKVAFLWVPLLILEYWLN